MAALVAPSAPGVEVRVVPCDSIPKVPLRVVAESLDGLEGEPLATLVLDAGALKGTLDLDPRSPWALEVEAPGVWSETRRVAPPVDEPVALHVWRRSTLVGRWSVPQAEKGPDLVSWRLRPVREERSVESVGCPVEELVVACAVGDSGSFGCPLPAGRWNLRAKAEGWAAQHFWALDLVAGEEIDQGTLVLRRGATVVGEVTTVDGPAHPKATRIELRPLGFRDDDPGAGEQRRALDLRTGLNDQGYFVFEDVPAGLYELTAHQPGYSRARLGSVEVRSGLETTIVQPLVLGPPVHLTIEVAPPHAPSGALWRLGLDPAGETTGGSIDAVEGEADDTGRWTSPALEVGEYWVQVLDDSGNVLAWQGPMAFGDSEAPYLYIPLGLVEVAGSVRLGGEPLAAELWFGGQTGGERVHVVSDEEGGFAAVLPREGAWTVDVLAEASAVSARGYSLDVEAGDDDLVIDLPATELAGEVVDSSGSPVPEALVRVILVGEGNILGASTDGQGRFVRRGLTPGTYWLEAEHGERSSARHTAIVAEDLHPPVQRLVIEERMTLAGRIVSGRGAVPGAGVLGLPFLGDGSIGAASEVVTAVDGSFELRLPGATAETLIVVMPLGFGLTIRRVEGRGPVELRPAPAEGALQLPRSPQGAGREIGLVLFGDEPVDVSILRRWARMNGAEPAADAGLTVPALPSGQVAYCTMAIEEAMLVVAGHARPTRCSRGFLPVGGEVALPPP